MLFASDDVQIHRMVRNTNDGQTRENRGISNSVSIQAEF